MSMAKIRKGDRVVILTGKDKGREGEVLRSIPKDGKVVVAGVNMISRHTKPSQADPEGGIKQREAAIARRECAQVARRAIAHKKRWRPDLRVERRVDGVASPLRRPSATRP